MPEQLTKHPEVTLKVLRSSGAKCAEGATQEILTQCPAQRFCKLPGGEICVFGLSEALRSELRPHRIGVTAVCPGIINTPITRAARMRGQAETPEARAALVEMYERRNYGPERVAANILGAIRRNRAVAPISPEAHVLYALKRLAPGLTARLGEWLEARMERRIQAPKAR